MTGKFRKSLAIMLAFTMCILFNATASAAEYSEDRLSTERTGVVAEDNVAVPYSTTVGSVVFSPTGSSGVLPSSGSKTTTLTGIARMVGYIIQPSGSATTLNVTIRGVTRTLIADGKYHTISGDDFTAIPSNANVTVSYSGAGSRICSISIVFGS